MPGPPSSYGELEVKRRVVFCSIAVSFNLCDSLEYFKYKVDMAIKILIVENNDVVAQDLHERLKNFGYEVVGISASSNSTIESIKITVPDLIIMNIRLQEETDGIKTGQLVRSRHNIPIIYMVEFAEQSTIVKAKSTEPFGYIFIPFNDNQVFTTVEIALLRNQYEKEIHRQAERAQTLVKSAAELNSTLDLKHVLDTICNLTNQAIKASGTGVFMLDRKKNIYHNVSSTSEIKPLLIHNENKFDVAADFINSTLSAQDRVGVFNNVRDLKDIPFLELLKKGNIKSIVVAGIFHNHELIGILVSIFVDTSNSLQIADVDLLKGLADQAAISITNANLFRQLHIGRENQRKLAKNIVDVQEEERRRLARELHDHLGQILTGMQFMLEGAKNQEGAVQKASMEEIQKTVSNVIGQIREMSLNLRPSMLDDMGLLPTLQWHIERFEAQTGLHIALEYNKIQNRFSAEVEIAAYRIIQEALTNVARHANVKEVFVGLVVQDDTLWIEILDQGAGFDPSAAMNKPTSGLSGMRERASLAGGYMVIESFIDQGTQIVVALPLSGKPLERRKFERNNRRFGR